MAQFSFRLPITSAVLTLVASLAGCGDDGPRRLKAPDGRALGRVVGWVTLDGQPLAGETSDQCQQERCDQQSERELSHRGMLRDREPVVRHNGHNKSKTPGTGRVRPVPGGSSHHPSQMVR